MQRKFQPGLDRLAGLLAALFALDRLLKLAAVVSFFRRPPPPDPAPWPTVTLLQPITRGASALRDNLAARAQFDYPAAIQHLLICDVADVESQAVCRALLAAHPELCAEVVLVEPDGGAVASKIAKLRAALPGATGDVLCFVDDDVGLRPAALRGLIPYLFLPRAGAVFGLACYTEWRTLWSSLMSAFVNANALLSYIPLTYLAEPFTITGHCFALRRTIFQAAGGLDGMGQHIGDDHELARRLRGLGLHAMQTPMVYDVANRFDSLRAYAAQMKRWFIFPRQALLPLLARREQAISLVGSVGNLAPSLLALLALLTRRRGALRALGASLGLFGAVYALCEARYLKRCTPARRWPLLPVVALFTPLQIVAALLSSDEIEWRGQRMRIRRGGGFEVL